MALPANVSYGTVTGLFLQAVADTPTDPDRAPDGLPATGLNVTFTASISPAVVRDTSATPPAMIVVQPVIASVDATGTLIGADGAAGVTLLATTNAALDPHGWVWTVTLASSTFPRLSFSFALDPGATVDLATVVQVPVDQSATLAAWLQAVADAQAARDAAEAAAASVPSAASLAATYLHKHANRVALFGDSILHLDTPHDDAGNPITGSSGSYWGGAMVQHANTLLGRRFTVTDDFAVPGNTTTQMVARLADVLASAADVVIFMGGTNDIGASTPASTIIGNYQTIHDAVLGAGKTLVHCTITPADAFTTTAQQTARAAANRWILEQADTRPGLTVVAWDADITDPATGYTLAHTTNDGTHPSTLGGLLLGRALAPTLAGLFPDRGNGWLPSSNADPYNALPNGVMLGSNAASGTNVSGVTPNQWGLSGNAHTAVAGAKLARTDGKPGEWAEVSFTGLLAPSGGDDTGNAGVYWGLAAPFLGPGGYVAASSKTFAAFEVSTEGFANATGFYIELIYISAGNFVGVTYAYRPNNFGGDVHWTDFEGTIRLPLVNTPAGVDTIAASIHASAANGQTVKVRVGRHAIYFI